MFLVSAGAVTACVEATGASAASAGAVTTSTEAVAASAGAVFGVFG